jgi:hypothetical protein
MCILMLRIVYAHKPLAYCVSWLVVSQDPEKRPKCPSDGGVPDDLESQHLHTHCECLSCSYP